jgi:hypothetical protein
MGVIFLVYWICFKRKHGERVFEVIMEKSKSYVDLQIDIQYEFFVIKNSQN